jgi:hypothetical protein
MTIASHGSLKSWALKTAIAATFALGLGANTAAAADWSVTELQFQYGKLDSPFAGGEHGTPIITLQHASGYSFGDVFFFIDFLDDDVTDGFNDKDAYAEFYAYFSSAKITGRKYGGPIKDIGLVLGANYDADVDYFSYLPGGYIDWNVSGFAFLRTQFTAVIDDSGIAQDDGYQFDVSWAYPFQVHGQRFSFEGHAEYTANTKNEFGSQKDWVLAQPQLRWDVGYAVTGKKDQFFVGTEYQFWANKLGTDVDESAFQALGVWRF